MTVYASVVINVGNGSAVKSYIDGLSLTSINHITVTALSPQSVLVVVEGT